MQFFFPIRSPRKGMAQFRMLQIATRLPSMRPTKSGVKDGGWNTWWSVDISTLCWGSGKWFWSWKCWDPQVFGVMTRRTWIIQVNMLLEFGDTLWNNILLWLVLPVLIWFGTKRSCHLPIAECYKSCFLMTWKPFIAAIIIDVLCLFI